MAGILEYSSDRTSNTTINGIGIAGSDSVKHGNDAIQQLMADLRTAVTKITDKGAGSYTAVKADHNQCWRVTGTATINLTAAATLTAGWCLWVMADGATATIDPAGSEKINGGDTLALTDGNAALIFCTATDFRAIIFNAAFDASALLPKSGGVMTGGLDFGTSVASSPTDLTRHIALYTAQYGFTVTASNLNYVSSHSHSFYSGANLRGKLDNAGNWTISGKATVGAGPSADLDVATKKYVDDEIAANEVTSGAITSALGYTPAGFYTGSTVDNTNYPVGQVLACNLPTETTRNASVTPRLGSASSEFTAASGTVVSGTWRTKGKITTGMYIIQRVA